MRLIDADALEQSHDENVEMEVTYGHFRAVT